MTEQQWTTQDKTAWGDGPWQDEPDKVQWIDGATQLDCLAVRNRLGVWCGYVGVPREHPLHGVYPDDHGLDVHGGITFASVCDEGAPPGHGICHIPAPGRPADVWWIGFDCGHAFDVMPGLVARERQLGLLPEHLSVFPDETYKTLGYVRGEATSLAWQLSRLGA